MMTVDQQRALVRDIARSWKGTPYRHRAAVRGSGVDCARILIEVYAEAGLIERFDPGKYTRDWHLHRNEERYLATIESYAGKPIKEDTSIHLWETEGYKPLTGDILVWRVGRTFSHSAIVTEWPFVVHASAPSMIVEEIQVDMGVRNATHNRPVRVYSLWRAT
jgi:cell wall-associated NlpC family hydrolase